MSKGRIEYNIFFSFFNCISDRKMERKIINNNFKLIL